RGGCDPRGMEMLDLDLLRHPGRARHRPDRARLQPDQHIVGRFHHSQADHPAADVVAGRLLHQRSDRRRAVRVDAGRAYQARSVGNAPGQLSRLASRLVSMLPPLMTATVVGPGASCSRAAYDSAPSPSATTFADEASSGIAVFSRGSGTTSPRSTNRFKSSNIRWSNGPPVPSAIVSGLIVNGPPLSNTRGHIA